MMSRDEAFLRQGITDPDALETALARLKEGVPVAHLLGEWDFYDLTFFVSEQCLIPRPDTEHLAEYLIRNLPKNAFFWDLCCGSGCIAVTVLKHRPDTKALAVDLSGGALEIARKNAHRHGVEDRITIRKADVLEGLPDACAPDAIVSNPPYIASAVVDTLDESVRNYEPRMALDGGADGLDFYRVLLSRFAPALKQGDADAPAPFLALEIGYDQGDALRVLAQELLPTWSIEVHRDYANNDRVVILKR